MAEHDKHPSSVDAVANTQPSQGRRRLVKAAALTLPAVITLRSGAAFASTFKTEDNCTIKENGVPTAYSILCWASIPGNPTPPNLPGQ